MQVEVYYVYHIHGDVPIKSFMSKKLLDKWIEKQDNPDKYEYLICLEGPNRSYKPNVTILSG